MAQQKKGLITRLLEGKEKSEEYARSTLPTNRWQLFWDIFKGNFGKIVKVNLLTLIFFIPMVLVALTTTFVGGELHRRFKYRQQAFSDLSDFVNEKLGGMKVYQDCAADVYSNDSTHSGAHSFREGFCDRCGAFEPALLNGNVYEISNAGQLVADPLALCQKLFTIHK